MSRCALEQEVNAKEDVCLQALTCVGTLAACGCAALLTEAELVGPLPALLTFDAPLMYLLMHL